MSNVLMPRTCDILPQMRASCNLQALPHGFRAAVNEIATLTQQARTRPQVKFVSIEVATGKPPSEIHVEHRKFFRTRIDRS